MGVERKEAKIAWALAWGGLGLSEKGFKKYLCAPTGSKKKTEPFPNFQDNYPL